MAADTDEVIKLGQLTIRFLVEGATSGGSVAIFEFSVGPGAKVPIAHGHDAYEETIYGIEGVLTMTVEENRHEIRPGDALCIRRGAVHRFDNFHSTEAKALAIVSPGILRPDFFREVRDVLAAAAGGPPDIAKVGEVMRRHGLTPAP
jgi:quercetin dioxygenase-like cupin family protein